MRFLKSRVSNFASYKQLSFSFDSLGLSLIHGPTGAGKSTIFDIIPWILFGKTAKNGAVDDVRSWSSDSTTTGILFIETPNGIVTVYRARSANANENDLYWTEEETPGKEERGKDITETQKNLNKRLGINFNLYCSAAYFNEFSPPASFFISSAKERRSLLENIVNLSLPATLAERTSSAKKEIKSQINALQSTVDKFTGRHDSLLTQQSSTEISLRKWEAEEAIRIQEIIERNNNFKSKQQERIQALETKERIFENNRNAQISKYTTLLDVVLAKADELPVLEEKIDKLTKQIRILEIEKCPTCGGPHNKQASNIAREALAALQQRFAANKQYAEQVESYSLVIQENRYKANPYSEELQTAKNMENPYTALLSEQKAENPFQEVLLYITEDLKKSANDLAGAEEKLEAKMMRFDALNQLYDLSFDLRAQLLRNTVNKLEEVTNSYLDEYFDAEIRVTFSVKDADNIDVFISKSGNECNYAQLSKGQRQLLKLCFSVAVMQATANQCGTHFGSLFFDEALDGLDSELKVKAYRLFEKLSTEHESVLLIDHALELREMFDKRYQVELQGDYSYIRLENEE